MNDYNYPDLIITAKGDRINRCEISPDEPNTQYYNRPVYRPKEDNSKDPLLGIDKKLIDENLKRWSEAQKVCDLKYTPFELFDNITTEEWVMKVDMGEMDAST